jgi:hypothetical protein
MKTDGRTVLAAINSFAEKPTAASTWHALAGSPFTDAILEWPADLCALTNVILKRIEARTGPPSNSPSPAWCAPWSWRRSLTASARAHQALPEIRLTWKTSLNHLTSFLFGLVVASDAARGGSTDTEEVCG